MKQLKTAKKFSLTFSLSSSFLLVVLLTAGLVGAVTYPNIKDFIRKGIKERLKDAASIGALQIDARKHSLLNVRADEELPEYTELSLILRNIRDHGTGMRFVYTVKKRDDKFIFVVDPEEDDSEVSHLGDIVEEVPLALRESFTAPYQAEVVDDFYTDEWGTWLTSYAPVLDSEGNLEAVLAIDMSAKKVMEYEKRYLIIFITVVCIVIVIVSLISLLMSKRICKPMLQLENDLEKMERFVLDDNMEAQSRIIEINNMAKAVRNMKNGLRSFKKYVPAELVRELITLHREAELGAENKKLTIFFCDIVGFTAISEAVSPEELAQRMGVYFDGMTKIILKHGGTVDKYIGDSIMAFWGAPHICEDQEVRACMATLECRQFVDELSKGWEAEGLSGFYTRFGINTGDVVVGNFGYSERLNYTAMGDNVNLASRLEGLNKNYSTKIIISESTYLQCKDVVACRILDRAVVKGRKRGVVVYELVDLIDSLSEGEIDRLDVFNQGMEILMRGELSEAKAHFERLEANKSGCKWISDILARMRSKEILKVG